MTEFDKDRLTGAPAIQQELRQFRKLRHLSDEDVAHRMAKDINEVRRLRISFGRGKTRLCDIGLNYHIRILLGEQGIKTVADIQAKSNAELLAIPLLGPKRLAYIREVIQSYMEKSDA